MRYLLLAVCLLVSFVPQASARVWHISPDGTGDAPTIDAGVDSAASGDTLLLADGVFTEPGVTGIRVIGKTIGFFSESGNPDACVIDCAGGAEWFCICFGGYDGAYRGGYGKVRGLTITNAGMAIEAWVSSSATVENCRFVNNTGQVVVAGGMAGEGYGSICVNDCDFRSNPSTQLSCQYKCSATANRCVFYQGGRVLSVGDDAHGTISGCTLVGNSGGTGGVVRGADHDYLTSSIMISGCIIAFNIGTPVVCNMSLLGLSCTDIWGNTGGDYVGCAAGLDGAHGNFSADPLFCDYLGGDLRLQVTSPCLPGNHPLGTDCGVMGAVEEACETATEPTTWGAIKAMY
ncbi:MAG: right-handed parallel beta-helix repeat-containing protein [bacterium]